MGVTASVLHTADLGGLGPGWRARLSSPWPVRFPLTCRWATGRKRGATKRSRCRMRTRTGEPAAAHAHPAQYSHSMSTRGNLHPALYCRPPSPHAGGYTRHCALTALPDQRCNRCRRTARRASMCGRAPHSLPLLHLPAQLGVGRRGFGARRCGNGRRREYHGLSRHGLWWQLHHVPHPQSSQPV